MSESYFSEKTQQLISFVTKGNLTESQRLISEMKDEFKMKLDQISFWQACLYMFKDEKESALNELQTTLEQGYWWNPDTLRNEPDLSSLKNDKRFIKIIESCEGILKEKRENVKAVVQRYGNSVSDTVVIIFHWRGSNIKDFSEYWLNEEIQEKYHLVFIQSSQVFGYNSYCWDDLNTAKRDILPFLNEFSGKKIILAGASQGALIAIDLTLDDLDKGIQGFFSVVPAIKGDKAFEQRLLNKEIRNKKGFILTGTKDSYYENTVKLASKLNEEGITTELTVKKELGHFFPNDFGNIEIEALKFLSD